MGYSSTLAFFYFLLYTLTNARRSTTNVTYYVCQSAHHSTCTSLDNVASSLNTLSSTQTELTMILQEGTSHQLNRRFDTQVTSIRNLNIQSVSSTIYCNGNTQYWFYFYDIHQLNISGVNFVNCTGITINITNAYISHSSFSHFEHFTDCLYLKNSSCIMSNVTFNNNSVDHNIVSFNSNLTLSNVITSFCHSVAMIYLSKNSVLYSINERLNDNFGHILLTELSTVNIQRLYIKSPERCEIFSNISHLVISKVNLDSDCSITTHNSHVIIRESSFTSLTGALVTSSNSTLDIHSVNFAGNAPLHSGIIEMANSKAYFSSTNFLNNSAPVNSGIITIRNSTTHFNNSIFSNFPDLNEDVYSEAAIFSTNSQILLLNDRFGSHGNIISDNTTVTIFNTSFTGLRRTLIVTNGGGLNVSNSSFIGNKAVMGGAVRISTSSALFYFIKFINNSASTGGAIDATSSGITLKHCLFLSNVASKGGAIQATDASVVTMLHVNFTKNWANLEGGAVYLAQLTELHSTFTTFQNNTGNSSGGGLLLFCSVAYFTRSAFLFNNATYGGGLHIFNFSSVYLSEVNFKHNSGYFGGPIFIFFKSSLSSDTSLAVENNRGKIMHGSDCNITIKGRHTFFNNGGGMSLSSCNVSIAGVTVIENNTLIDVAKFDHGHFAGDVPRNENINGALEVHVSQLYISGNLSVIGNSIGGLRCTNSKVYINGDIVIANNRGREQGGGLYAFHSTISIFGTISITHNTAEEGGGIYAGSSTIKFYSSSVSLASNKATYGGGIYMKQSSKLSFTSEASRLIFINNTASDNGGAMYVNDTTYFSTCSSGDSQEMDHEYECFIQASGDHFITSTIHIKFYNNTAMHGKLLYGGLLDRCIMRLNTGNGISMFTQIVTSQSDNTNSSLVELVDSEPMQVCPCIQNRIDCTQKRAVRDVFKGQTLHLHVSVVDVVGKSKATQVFAQLTAGRNNRLGRGQSIQQTKNSCTSLEYNVFSEEPEATLQIHPQGLCDEKGISKYLLELKFKHCPIGFQSSESNTSCECHSILSGFNHSCNISIQAILRLDHFWVSYVNMSGVIIHPHCPYDYCYPSTKQVFVNLNSKEGSDSQCALNRSGTLCGACKDGLSLVLGSSKCKACTNKTLALILPIAMAGIILIVLILTLNLVDSINGMILYANIIVINQMTFFPSESSTYYSTVVIAWLNLDIGIEACFYDGSDMYSRTWLELGFSLYLMGLMGIILFLKHRLNSYYIAKLLQSTKPVVGMATLMLMSFSKLLRVTASILSFTTISYPNYTEYVWLSDPTIQYLGHKHTPLFILALLLLIYLVTFATILVSSQWLVASKNKTMQAFLSRVYLKPLLTAYHSPLNTNHKCWTGILLLFRLASMLVVLITSNHGIILLLLMVMIYLLVIYKEIGGKLYRNHKNDIIETAQILNLGLLTVISLLVSSKTQAIVSSTSAYINTFTLILAFFHRIFIPIQELTTKKVSAYLKQQFHNSYQNNNLKSTHTISTNTTTFRTTIISNSTIEI